MWRRHTFLAVSMVHSMLGPLNLVAGTAYAIGISLAGHPALGVVIVGWWLGTQTIAKSLRLRRSGYSLRLLPALVGSKILLRAIRVAALLTVRRQGWLTRTT